jgi:hypothetical protein
MGATATLKSAIQTIIKAGGTPATWALPGLIDGRVKVLLDNYTGLGTGEDAGSVITWPALPTGANILQIFIGTSVATTSLTVSVGDADSATRYANASTTLATTAGLYPLTALGALPRVVGTSTNDANIIWTTGGAALGTGTVYTLMVLYSFD